MKKMNKTLAILLALAMMLALAACNGKNGDNGNSGNGNSGNGNSSANSNNVSAPKTTSVHGYQTCIPVNSHVRLRRGKVHYALMTTIPIPLRQAVRSKTAPAAAAVETEADAAENFERGAPT